MTKRCIDKCTEALTKHTSPDLVTLVIMLSIQSILVVTYGCESWIIKKSECQIINAFKLWSWRRLLKVPWNARRSNQSILKEINSDFIARTDAEADAPILWPPDATSQLIRKPTLMLGKIKGKRRRGRQRMRCLDGSLTQWTWVWASSGRWGKIGKPGVLQSMELTRVGYDWSTEKFKDECFPW